MNRLGDEELVEAMKNSGREWFASASMLARAQFYLITTNPNWIKSIPRQLEGQECGRATVSEHTQASHEMEGPPKITFKVTRRWLCPGLNCDMICVKDTKLADFISVSELQVGPDFKFSTLIVHCSKVGRWLVAHKLIPDACTTEGCAGTRRLVADNKPHR